MSRREKKKATCSHCGVYAQLLKMNGHNDKTNVDLNYATIVTNLSKGQLDSLNVEDFIEQENINLGQHQSNKNKKELKLEERDKLII